MSFLFIRSTVLIWLLVVCVFTCLFPSSEPVHRHRPPRSQWEESQGFGYICLRAGLLQGAGSQSKSHCTVYLCAGILGFLIFLVSVLHCALDWLQELSDQAGAEFDNADVRWVITVPAIWKMPAKQFMREAAYKVQHAYMCNMSLWHSLGFLVHRI